MKIELEKDHKWKKEISMNDDLYLWTYLGDETRNAAKRRCYKKLIGKKS